MSSSLTFTLRAHFLPFLLFFARFFSYSSLLNRSQSAFNIPLDPFTGDQWSIELDEKFIPYLSVNHSSATSNAAVPSHVPVVPLVLLLLLVLVLLVYCVHKCAFGMLEFSHRCTGRERESSFLVSCSKRMGHIFSNDPSQNSDRAFILLFPLSHSLPQTLLSLSFSFVHPECMLHSMTHHCICMHACTHTLHNFHPLPNSTFSLSLYLNVLLYFAGRINAFLTAKDAT